MKNRKRFLRVLVGQVISSYDPFGIASRHDRFSFRLRHREETRIRCEVLAIRTLALSTNDKLDFQSILAY